MYKIPTMEDVQKIMDDARTNVRRLQRADELEEVAVFIAAASLQECKLIIDDLIDRVSTLVGLAPELEDAAASLNRSIIAETNHEPI